MKQPDCTSWQLNGWAYDPSDRNSGLTTFNKCIVGLLRRDILRVYYVAQTVLSDTTAQRGHVTPEDLWCTRRKLVYVCTFNTVVEDGTPTAETASTKLASD
jgi:hypothetical protein